MNVNNCGKGLVVLSISLTLGVGITSLFISENQLPENIEQPKISNQSKQICVKQDKSFEDYEDGKMVLIPCEIDNKIYFLEPENDSQKLIESIEKNEIEVKKLKNRVKK